MEGEQILAIEGQGSPRSSESKEILKRRYDVIEIRGDAVFAATLGRDRDLVQGIEVNGFNFEDETLSGEIRLDDYKGLRPLLNRREFRRLKRWIKKNGYRQVPVVFRSQDYTVLRERTPYKDIFGVLSMDIGGNPEYISFADFPRLPEDKLVLEPAENLKDLLNCMEMGEKWRIPVNTDLLDKADAQVRSGRIVLTTDTVTRSKSSFANKENTSIDDELASRLIVKLRSHKEQYQALADVCAMIVEEGGVAQYINGHFGPAYLKDGGSFLQTSSFKPGSVRLYYPDLTRSQKSIEEQRLALSIFYSKDTPQLFKYKSVLRTGSVKEIPASESVRELVDREKLRRATEEGDLEGLRPLVGTYVAGYESMVTEREEDIKEKVDLLVEALVIDNVRFWKTGSPKISRKLARILDTRNPVFSLLDYSGDGEVEIVISQDPMAILQASTEKPWTSCVNLNDGTYRNGLYQDVKNGSAIAYLFRDSRPIGRRILRFSRTLDGRPAVGIEAYYGDVRYRSMSARAIEELAKQVGIVTNERSFTQGFFSGANTDVGKFGRDGRIYYGFDDQMEVRRISSGNVHVRNLVRIIKSRLGRR